MKTRKDLFYAAGKLRLTGTLMVLVLLLSGCTSSPAAREEIKLESQNQRLSYALGMALGKQFRDQAIEIDLDSYSLGLEDAMTGGPTLMTEAESLYVVNLMQKDLKRKSLLPRESDGVPAEIAVSFKLDPRLTQSMYMGHRWVSPPVFTQVGQKDSVTVEATAKVLDAKGMEIPSAAEWTPGDPGMVTIEPGPGKDVRITINREGRSPLKISAAGVSRELDVTAIRRNDALEVQIAQ